MRKIILAGLGILLIVLSYFGAKKIIANKEKKKPKTEKSIQSIFVESVENKNIPITVTSTGNCL